MKMNNIKIEMCDNYIKNLHPEYITDEMGNKKSVILSISDFNDLMEDISDLAIVAERIGEPVISHENLLAELKQNGIV